MDRPTVKPPLLSWYGGKTGMAEWIVSLMPPHTAYLEPYAGSLAVLARKPRSESETVNDFHGEIVNLYRVCRDNGHELAARLDLTPYARAEWVDSEPCDDPVERARRYVVRVEQMFAGDQVAGTWTIERSGNRRMGAWLNVGERVAALGQRLDGVFIENSDALALIPKWTDNPDALIYLDPPYTMDVRSGAIYAVDVDDAHHERMADAVRDAKACVMVSGYDNPAYRSLFDGWTKHYRKTVVGGRGGPRSERVEVIWTNRVEETLFGLGGGVA